MEAAPTVGYCSGCRGERRLRFGGYAADGRENGRRPRAYYRACLTCGKAMLVLADATDALGLVRNAIRDWRRSTGADGGNAAGDPTLRSIDLDDLEGELTIALWSLYSVWDPRGLSFASYASGLLPRRIASYVRDAVGGDALYRNNGRSLVRVWPKAHATAVCVSLDGAAAAQGSDAGEDGGDRLARAFDGGAADGPEDRSLDLGRLLARRGS